MKTWMFVVFLIASVAAFSVVFLLSQMGETSIEVEPEEPSTNATGTQGRPPSIAVAIYSGKGTWNESVRALQKMFAWMNYTFELVEAEEINGGGLCSFSVLCVPGGDMYQYSLDISDAGRENVRRFVRGGGGYMGVCGGAYFASERVVWRGSQLQMTPLGLFPGTAEGPVDEVAPYPGYGMCCIEVSNRTHPATEPEPEAIWVLYYWGPALLPEEGSDVGVLGRYAAVGKPAIVAFDYGSGRVFLVGAHPEIEEDSDRDGGSFASELDDQGSDWGLMEKAVGWLIGG